MELSAFLLLPIFFCCVDLKVFFKFKATTCGTSGKSAIEPYCYLKAYSRNYPLLNFGYNFSRRVSDGVVYFVVEHKLQADSYRDVINYPDVPLCKYLKDSNANPFFQAIIDTTRQIAPHMLECCARTGEFKVANMTFVNTTFLLMWPSGDYRTTFRYFDTVDSNVVNLTFAFAIRR